MRFGVVFASRDKVRFASEFLEGGCSIIRRSRILGVVPTSRFAEAFLKVQILMGQIPEGVTSSLGRLESSHPGWLPDGVLIE